MKQTVTRRAIYAIKRAGKNLCVLACFGLAAVSLLLVCMAMEHRIAVNLPIPTGSFAVGRITHWWVELAGNDLATSNPKPRRTVFAWIWYPAAASVPPEQKQDYFPESWRRPFEASIPALIRLLLERDLSDVHAQSLREPVVSPVKRAYPVILFRGGGSTLAVEYSALAEDLASHGYVVVGIDAPTRSRIFVMPDGSVVERSNENNPEAAAPDFAFEQMLPRMVDEWTGDVAFTLDRLAQLDNPGQVGSLTGKLDLTRVGVVGHSIGGAVAAQFCLRDARCKVGIDIDGLVPKVVAQNALPVPFLFLMSDHSTDDPNDPIDEQIAATLDAAFRLIPSQSRHWLGIRGADHFNFSDGAVAKSHIGMTILRLIGVVNMQPSRQLEISAYCVRTFLDAYLGDASTAVPPAPESLYAEIEVRR